MRVEFDLFEAFSELPPDVQDEYSLALWSRALEETPLDAAPRAVVREILDQLGACGRGQRSLDIPLVSLEVGDLEGLLVFFTVVHQAFRLFRFEANTTLADRLRSAVLHELVRRRSPVTDEPSTARELYDRMPESFKSPEAS